MTGFVSGAQGAAEDRQWLGLYDAQVAVATDPLGKGRVRLYVPQVLGNTYSAWAFPMQPGLNPAVGVACFCIFLGGNPDLPYYFLGITGNVLQQLTANTGLVLNPNPYFTGNVITGYAGTGGTVQGLSPNQDTNPPYVSAIEWIAAGTGGGYINESLDPISTGALQPYQVTAWVYYPLGGTVSIGMAFTNAAHGGLANQVNNVTVAAGTWQQVSTTINSPATAAFGWPIIGPTTSTAGMQFQVEALQVIGSIPGALITPGTVTTNQIASGTITNSNLNSSVTARSIGGITTTISGTTPVGAIANDIWIDSANGYQLQQYNGTSFVPIQFTASDVLLVGSITAGQIAANTITASQLAAGIIYAGIIDGTLVQAATLIGGTILSYGANTARGPYAESFEGSGSGGFTNGTWTLSGCTSTFSSTWSSDLAFSLKLTTSGTGTFNATSPHQACTPNDPVTISVDFNSPSVAYTHLFVSIHWFDSGSTFISSTTSPVASIVANAPITLQVSGNAPSIANGASADAAFYDIQAGDSGSAQPGSSILYLDNAMASGNLTFSASPAGGTDGVGNTIDQGITIAGLSGLNSAFTVTDPFGNTLASVDGAGNVVGATVASGGDVSVAGQSLTAALSSVFEPDPWHQMTLLNSVTSGTTGNQFPSYRLSNTENICYISGTIKNTQSNTIFFKLPSGYFNPNTQVQFWAAMFSNTLGGSIPATTSVYGQCDTSGNLSILNLPGGGSFSGVVFNGALYLDIPNGPTTGGTTGNQQTITKNYECSATYCYFGSGATNGAPGARRNTNGLMYHGQYGGGQVNGSQFSYANFSGSPIASDLSGATINTVKIAMTNQHSWYNSGMTLIIGTTTRTMPTGTPIGTFATGNTPNRATKFFTEGQAQTFDVTGAGIGTAFQSGGATGLLFGDDSTTDVENYGYFTGGPNQVTLQINYTK